MKTGFCVYSEGVTIFRRGFGMGLLENPFKCDVISCELNLDDGDNMFYEISKLIDIISLHDVDTFAFALWNSEYLSWVGYLLML